MTAHGTAGVEFDSLTALCRAGRLFEVQEWIETGKPIAMPKELRPGSARRYPLRIAMDTGFHSLVQVLLEAGAPIREGAYDALEHAVNLRRADLAALLLAHGADVSSVSMRFVVEMWQAEIVDLFLANGASLAHDSPIAWGLIHKIRPVLGLVKRYASDRPDLMRQAELALRHHVLEGSGKWVALILWAGADPCARGPARLGELDVEEEDWDYLSAVELALSYGQLDILKSKKLRAAMALNHAEPGRLLEQACHAADHQPLSLLLELGHEPGRLRDGGTAVIGRLLDSMSWGFPFTRMGTWSGSDAQAGIDSSRARERMKMLHMIVAKGAKWLPLDEQAIRDARRCLLRMAPAYVLEFVWLMQFYKAARRRDVQELLRTSAMVRLLGGEREDAANIVAEIPEELRETI